MAVTSGVYTVPSGTFVYSPDIQVWVGTDKYLYDLSADIESFSLTRSVNAESTFQCVINNKFRKYDGGQLIPRMSRLVVFLKRISWLQVFSGFVSTIPYETVTPGSVTITAYDTVRRLEHIYWDPFSVEAQDFFPAKSNAGNNAAGMSEDGGAAASMFRILTEVAKWPADQILIEHVPQSFVDKAATLALAIEVDQTIVEVLTNLLNGNIGEASGDAAVTTNTGQTHPAPGAGTGTGYVGTGTPANTAGIEMILAAFPGKICSASGGPVYIGPVIKNIAGTSTPSQHSYANATDMFTHDNLQSPSADKEALFQWCVAHCGDLKAAHIIYTDRSWSYTDPTIHPYTGVFHGNHVHIDYLPQYSGSPPGSPDLASATQIVPNNSNTPVAPGISTGTAGGPASPFSVFQYVPTIDFESQGFVGELAWINDRPLFETIKELSAASLRHFQSAPNGDLVFFFPDKWGHYGKEAVLDVRDIELIDFKLELSEEPLTTHVAVAGTLVREQEMFTGVAPNWMQTKGIVSVDQEETMAFLLNLDPKFKYKSSEGVDLPFGDWVKQRFGMRPLRQEQQEVRDHRWEFFLALHLFMERWSEQFLTEATFTFLPEMYPGMLVRLVDHDLRVYVESVSHSGSRDGGFQTTAHVSCPMRWNAGVGQWQLLEIEATPVAQQDIEKIVPAGVIKSQ